MFRKITGDALLYSIMPQLPRLINIALLPITTPYLNTTDFAVFGTVMAYVMGFDILKSLGMDIILMNSFFKDPGNYKKIWGQVEGVISVWSILLSIITGYIIFLILPGEIPVSDKLFVVLTTCIPSALFAGLSKIAVLYYQFNQKPVPIVVRSFWLGVLAVVINYYTIAELQLGYKGWFYSGLITGILLPLSYVHPIWTKEKLFPVYRMKWQELKKMLSISLPIVPHHYSSYFLNYSDRVLLNLFQIPSVQMGIYNLGYSVSGNFRYFTSSIDKVLGPTFHKMLVAKQDVRTMKFIVYALAAAYILIGFLGGIWMKECFYFLIRNEELTQAYTIAIIILFSFSTRPLYNGAQSFLFFEERSKTLWYVTFISGILNVMLNVIFIPRYGIMAAALTTFICITCSNYGVFLLKDYKETTKINFKPALWIISTIIIFYASWLLKDASLINKIAASTTGLLSCALFFFTIRKSMLQ